MRPQPTPGPRARGSLPAARRPTRPRESRERRGCPTWPGAGRRMSVRVARAFAGRCCRDCSERAVASHEPSHARLGRSAALMPGIALLSAPGSGVLSPGREVRGAARSCLRDADARAMSLLLLSRAVSGRPLAGSARAAVGALSVASGARTSLSVGLSAVRGRRSGSLRALKAIFVITRPLPSGARGARARSSCMRLRVRSPAAS